MESYNELSEIIVSKFENVLKTYISRDFNGNPVNGRESSVIIIVLRGKLEFIFSDISIICDSNHPIFIPKGAVYRLKGHEDAENLLFNFQAVTQPASALSLPAINHELAREYFERLENLTSKMHSSQHTALAVFYQFLSDMAPDISASHKSSVSGKAEEFVEKAEKLLIRNLSDPDFTCHELAAALNISEVYLRKLFVRCRNMPPSKYLTKLRMEKAKMYLSEINSVSETASHVGYHDIYQFSRAYKKYYGHAPSESFRAHP